MSGGWLALIGGALTGVVVSTVQRMYPEVSFVVLLGVGIVCGALFNVAMFVASRGKKR